MINIKVRTRGLNEFIQANEKVIAALDRGDLNKALAEKAEHRAKYRAPRKKGILVKSIKAKIINQFSFIFECSAENERGEDYPRFLEWGTRHIRVGTPESPRTITSSSGKTAFLPFMRWALWRTMQEANLIFKEKILKYYK